MSGLKKYIPDLTLLASTLVVLFLSGGDARIFLVAAVIGITLRYVFLSALIFLDWLRPGWFDASRLKRLTLDPGAGGAYEGGGAETPIVGHFVFILLFNYFPTLMIINFFGEIPLGASWSYVAWTSVAVAARDILVGRVVYFRSGAGQQQNASWNFTLALALMATLITAPAVLLVGSALLVLVSFLAGRLGYVLTIEAEAHKTMLWILSLWLVGVFHVLLFLQARSPSAAPATAVE